VSAGYRASVAGIWFTGDTIVTLNLFQGLNCLRSNSKTLKRVQGDGDGITTLIARGDFPVRDWQEIKHTHKGQEGQWRSGFEE
jgi:hypothetical protein